MSAVIAAVGATAPSVNAVALAPGLFVFGAGARTVITPLLTLVLAATRAAEAGTASGILTTIQRIGGALGVAVVGLIFFGLWDTGPAIALEWSLGATLVASIATAGLLTLLPAGTPQELAQRRRRAA